MALTAEKEKVDQLQSRVNALEQEVKRADAGRAHLPRNASERLGTPRNSRRRARDR